MVFSFSNSCCPSPLCSRVAVPPQSTLAFLWFTEFSKKLLRHISTAPWCIQRASRTRPGGDSKKCAETERQASNPVSLWYHCVSKFSERACEYRNMEPCSMHLEGKQPMSHSIHAYNWFVVNGNPNRYITVFACVYYFWPSCVGSMSSTGSSQIFFVLSPLG